MKTAESSIGEVYGRLTITGLSHIGPDRCWRVHCQCSCGKSKIIKFSAISSGGQQSCGCLRDETARRMVINRCTTHGMSGTPTYDSWSSMIQRCTNPTDSRFYTHGGRGISVCQRWLTFQNFLDDMGVKPAELTLDRIENDGDYEPGNCKWSTGREQALNRRTTRFLACDGEILCLKDLAAKIGMKRLTLTMRLKRGWTLEKAITTPVRSY